ncbi:uncharacterized protein LOC136032180 [Artemia franciscana]|nr:hypothetical protein QYM36_000291 [Artemia franciscana]
MNDSINTESSNMSSLDSKPHVDSSDNTSHNCSESVRSHDSESNLIGTSEDSSDANTASPSPPQTPMSRGKEDFSGLTNDDSDKNGYYQTNITIPEKDVKNLFAQPYNDLLVPVNQSKKGLRSGKLYITKELGGEKGFIRRYCCLSILALLLLSGIILGILAIAGVFDQVPAASSTANPSELIGSTTPLPSLDTNFLEDDDIVVEIGRPGIHDIPDDTIFSNNDDDADIRESGRHDIHDTHDDAMKSRNDDESDNRGIETSPSAGKEKTIDNSPVKNEDVQNERVPSDDTQSTEDIDEMHQTMDKINDETLDLDVKLEEELNILKSDEGNQLEDRKFDEESGIPKLSELDTLSTNNTEETVDNLGEVSVIVITTTESSILNRETADALSSSDVKVMAPVNRIEDVLAEKSDNETLGTVSESEKPLDTSVEAKTNETLEKATDFKEENPLKDFGLSTKASFGQILETPGPHVENVLDAEFKIENLEFTPELENASSPQYQALSNEIENELRRIILSSNDLASKEFDFRIGVVQFKSGSVVCHFRLGWSPLSSTFSTAPIFTPEILRDVLVLNMLSNNGFFLNYLVPVSSIAVYRVPDVCILTPNFCGGLVCGFSHELISFACTCPAGYQLSDDRLFCLPIPFDDLQWKPVTSSTLKPINRTGEGMFEEVVMEPTNSTVAMNTTPFVRIEEGFVPIVSLVDQVKSVLEDDQGQSEINDFGIEPRVPDRRDEDTIGSDMTSEMEEVDMEEPTVKEETEDSILEKGDNISNSVQESEDHIINNQDDVFADSDSGKISEFSITNASIENAAEFKVDNSGVVLEEFSAMNNHSGKPTSPTNSFILPNLSEIDDILSSNDDESFNEATETSIDGSSSGNPGNGSVNDANEEGSFDNENFEYETEVEVDIPVNGEEKEDEEEFLDPGNEVEEDSKIKGSVDKISNDYAQETETMTNSQDIASRSDNIFEGPSSSEIKINDTEDVINEEEVEYVEYDEPVENPEELGLEIMEDKQIDDILNESQLIKRIIGSAPVEQIVHTTDKPSIEFLSEPCGNWPLELESMVFSSRLGVSSVEWPSLARLFFVKEKRYCTGTIIDKEWIMGTYSCMKNLDSDVDPKGWVTFAGGPPARGRSSSNMQIRTVTGIIVHPNATSGLGDNNVVLVKLEKPLTLSDSVRSVCVTSHPVEERQACTVVGWRDGSTFSQYTKFLTSTRVNLSNCNLSKPSKGSNLICSEILDDDGICLTDDGAPMMCVGRGGLWELGGIYTKASRCTEERTNLLFAAASGGSRFQWLKDNIRR